MKKEGVSCLIISDTKPRQNTKGRKEGLTIIVIKVFDHGRDRQLLSEAINLVHEQNNRRLDKPLGIADRVKQCQGLLHAVHGLVLEQQLVVLGDGHQEHNRRHVLEAPDPFPALRALATDIEHAVGQVADQKGRLIDARGLDARPEHVLVCGCVVGLGDPVNGVEVAIFRTKVERY